MAGKHKDGMMEECKAMMAKKQKIEKQRLTMDATLDKLVVDMNATGSSNKPDAMEKPMAAVLTELIAQRKAIRAMEMKMHAEMMEHMMRHMHSRDAKGGMKGMSECPMMKMNDDHHPAPESN